MIASARNSLLLLLLTTRAVSAQSWPRTVAERTNFDSTSSSMQVGAFLDSLQLAGAPIAVS